MATMREDNYVPASFEQVVHRLDNDMFPNYRKKMIDYLWTHFHFDYNTRSHTRPENK